MCICTLKRIVMMTYLVLVEVQIVCDVISWHKVKMLKSYVPLDMCSLLDIYLPSAISLVYFYHILPDLTPVVFMDVTILTYVIILFKWRTWLQLQRKQMFLMDTWYLKAWAKIACWMFVCCLGFRKENTKKVRAKTKA